MSRSNLSDNLLYRPRIMNALKYGTAVSLAITANVTIADDAPVSLAYDATSTPRTITLPTATEGLLQLVSNISTGTAVLTIKNAAATTLGTVGPGEVAFCLVIGGSWYVFPLGSNLSTSYEGFYGASPVAQPSGATQNAITDSSGGTASDTIVATAPYQLVTVPVTAALLANGQEFQFDPGFAGKLVAINARATAPVTTGAKAATITGRVNAGALGGGGVVALSGTYAVGAAQAGTAITGANSFTAAQTFGCTVGSVTTFIEGAFALEFTLHNTDLSAAIAKIAAYTNKFRTDLVALGLIKGSA